MVTDIVREIDTNFAIPEGLKGVVPAETSTSVVVQPSLDPDVDIQNDSDEDEYSELDEDEINDDLSAPENIEVVEQIHRTAPDGRQVVDVYIEVEDVIGVLQYDVRKAVD